MGYDNRQYWLDLHGRLKGQLKAVGHPFLSEELNRLKYASESAGIRQAMHKVMDAFRRKNQRDLLFLDIGAGTGFWTDLIFHMLSSNGYQTKVVALDISSDALDVIRERLPEADVIKEDLATVSPDQYSNVYDVVSSFYCLHHIVKTKDFINALQFAGSSVRPDGFLLVMDPILTRPYSKLDSFELYSYRGNGIPRHLYFMDDILLNLGLRRVAMYPAISFILNGSIEAQSFLGYFIMERLWKLLWVFYRSEGFVHSTAGIWRYADTILKKMNLAFSSSLCVYQKISADADE